MVSCMDCSRVLIRESGTNRIETAIFSEVYIHVRT